MTANGFIKSPPARNIGRIPRASQCRADTVAAGQQSQRLARIATGLSNAQLLCAASRLAQATNWQSSILD